MDFALYLGAINATLLEHGLRKADAARVRKYFIDGFSAARAARLEADAQAREKVDADSAHSEDGRKGRIDG